MLPLRRGRYSSLATMGGATPYSTEAQQFFDRLLTPPVSARATLYAALIDALVAGGVWTKLDALYVFAAADSATSLINLKSASFQATLNVATGTPTFTADSGWSANGAPADKSVNTNFNPSTAGGQYTQNDALIGAWVIGTTTEQKAPIIQTSSSGNIELFTKYGGTSYWSVNTNGTEVAFTPGSAAGMFVAQRTASNALALYQDDVSISTSTTASAALVNENLVSDTVANTAAAVFIGASLTSGQRTAFYNALHTYMQTVAGVA